MFIISIQRGFVSPLTEISCDDEYIHDTLSLLESHPAVTAYSICSSVGRYTNDNLKYSFSGYMFPAGKAVEKFDWN